MPRREKKTDLVITETAEESLEGVSLQVFDEGRYVLALLITMCTGVVQGVHGTFAHKQMVLKQFLFYFCRGNPKNIFRQRTSLYFDFTQ